MSDASSKDFEAFLAAPTAERTRLFFASEPWTATEPQHRSLLLQLLLAATLRARSLDALRLVLAEVRALPELDAPPPEHASQLLRSLLGPALAAATTPLDLPLLEVLFDAFSEPWPTSVAGALEGTRDLLVRRLLVLLRDAAPSDRVALRAHLERSAPARLAEFDAPPSPVPPFEELLDARGRVSEELLTGLAARITAEDLERALEAADTARALAAARLAPLVALRGDAEALALSLARSIAPPRTHTRRSLDGDQEADLGLEALNALAQLAASVFAEQPEVLARVRRAALHRCLDRGAPDLAHPWPPTLHLLRDATAEDRASLCLALTAQDRTPEARHCAFVLFVQLPEVEASAFELLLDATEDRTLRALLGSSLADLRPLALAPFVDLRTVPWTLRPDAPVLPVCDSLGLAPEAWLRAASETPSLAARAKKRLTEGAPARPPPAASPSLPRSVSQPPPPAPATPAPSLPPLEEALAAWLASPSDDRERLLRAYPEEDLGAALRRLVLDENALGNLRVRAGNFLATRLRSALDAWLDQTDSPYQLRPDAPLRAPVHSALARYPLCWCAASASLAEDLALRLPPAQQLAQHARELEPEAARDLLAALTLSVAPSLPAALRGLALDPAAPLLGRPSLEALAALLPSDAAEPARRMDALVARLEGLAEDGPARLADALELAPELARLLPSRAARLESALRAHFGDERTLRRVHPSTEESYTPSLGALATRGWVALLHHFEPGQQALDDGLARLDLAPRALRVPLPPLWVLEHPSPRLRARALRLFAARTDPEELLLTLRKPRLRAASQLAAACLLAPSTSRAARGEELEHALHPLLGDARSCDPSEARSVTSFALSALLRLGRWRRAGLSKAQQLTALLERALLDGARAQSHARAAFEALDALGAAEVAPAAAALTEHLAHRVRETGAVGDAAVETLLWASNARPSAPLDAALERARASLLQQLYAFEGTAQHSAEVVARLERLAPREPTVERAVPALSELLTSAGNLDLARASAVARGVSVGALLDALHRADAPQRLGALALSLEVGLRTPRWTELASAMLALAPRAEERAAVPVASGSTARARLFPTSPLALERLYQLARARLSSDPVAARGVLLQTLDASLDAGAHVFAPPLCRLLVAHGEERAAESLGEHLLSVARAPERSPGARETALTLLCQGTLPELQPWLRAQELALDELRRALLLDESAPAALRLAAGSLFARLDLVLAPWLDAEGFPWSLRAGAPASLPVLHAAAPDVWLATALCLAPPRSLHRTHALRQLEVRFRCRNPWLFAPCLARFEALLAGAPGGFGDALREAAGDVTLREDQDTARSVLRFLRSARGAEEAR